MRLVMVVIDIEYNCFDYNIVQQSIQSCIIYYYDYWFKNNITFCETYGPIICVWDQRPTIIII